MVSDKMVTFNLQNISVNFVQKSKYCHDPDKKFRVHTAKHWLVRLLSIRSDTRLFWHISKLRKSSQTTTRAHILYNGVARSPTRRKYID
eukprot:6484552-Amphidinium_carterae.2